MRALTLLATLTALLGPVTASAQEKLICVYDPMGTSGPAYQSAQTMALDAAARGVKIKLRADIEEKTAAEDLAAGKCDGAVMTGVATRTFGLAAATLEAIGALPKYEYLKTTLSYLKDPRFAPQLRTGAFETAGIFPGGYILLYVRDKTWRNASALAGKSISIIGNDAAASTMAKEVGMSTKTSTTATFGPMFNSHSVDTAYAPATAHEALELYRGIGTAGGIIDFPLSQLTLQLVIRTASFPADFGQWGREYSYGVFDKALAQVKAADAKVAKHMLPIPDADKPGYEDRFLKVRLKLKETGVYSSIVLGLMKKVRCKADATRAECAQTLE